MDSVQPESAGLSDAGMVLGGVALSAIFLLAAFIAFDCLRELNQSDAEAEKERERERRGVVRQKSFRGWAIVGILMCLLVMKHVHHLSTAPMMSEEEVARVLADPASHPVGEIFNAHPAFKGDEKKVKAALEKHLDNNPLLTQPRPMAEAKEEHLLAGGVAAAFIMFLLAYLVIDFLREFNRKSHLGQTEQDKRAALRCWALLGIIICCVIVKQLHHAHTNEATDELDDLHASKYAPEKVGGVVPEGAQWIEEHGVMRVKQASDEVTGDVRTCAYEKQRCMCEGHVRYGDGDSWTDWRDVEESIMCTNDAFGTDPAPHKVKVCQCRPEIRKCADEGEMCACEGGRVRYGKGDSWTEWEDMEELVKAYPNDVSSDKILCKCCPSSVSVHCLERHDLCGCGHAQVKTTCLVTRRRARSRFASAKSRCRRRASKVQTDWSRVTTSLTTSTSRRVPRRCRRMRRPPPAPRHRRRPRTQAEGERRRPSQTRRHRRPTMPRVRPAPSRRLSCLLEKSSRQRERR